MNLKTLLLLTTLALPLNSAPSREPAPSKEFFTYPNYTFAMLRPHLDQLAAAVKDEPGAQAYIIIYGGRGSCEAWVRRRIRLTSEYMARRHRLKGDRIRVVSGGRRADSETELFVRAAGQLAPTAAPDIAVPQGRAPSGGGRCAGARGRVPRGRA